MARVSANRGTAADTNAHVPAGGGTHDDASIGAARPTRFLRPKRAFAIVAFALVSATGVNAYLLELSQPEALPSDDATHVVPLTEGRQSDAAMQEPVGASDASVQKGVAVTWDARTPDPDEAARPRLVIGDIYARDIDDVDIRKVVLQANLLECYKRWLRGQSGRREIKSTLYLSFGGDGGVEFAQLQTEGEAVPAITHCVEESRFGVLPEKAVGSSGAHPNIKLIFKPR